MTVKVFSKLKHRFFQEKNCEKTIFGNSGVMIRRLFVEEKNGHSSKALLDDLRENLNIEIPGVRILQRYDVEGLDDSQFEAAKNLIFCEAPVENVYEESFPSEEGDAVFAVEYLPGQFDQRADSAEQCVQIVAHTRPVVACARVYVFCGGLSGPDMAKIKRYLINSVDSREASLEKPDTLLRAAPPPPPVKRIHGFIAMSDAEIGDLHAKMSLAMSVKDLAFCRDYFAGTEGRDPTITEIRVLDTYWSDHCRHTTFLTHLESVKIDSGKYSKPVEESWKKYLAIRKKLDSDARGKHVCLMDVALAGMRALRLDGKLADLEESEEINAASIVVDVDVGGEMQQWLVMFKNETHNHPTEIEPFGGAATCLGGAIRDPLSGRSYVYQAMRVSGAGDPRTPFEKTLPGKLPQRKIVVGAANGYSSYGNQIGLATGQVVEIYDPGYVAKRMEIGAVVAAAPRTSVRRGTPEKGDAILLVGGRTGRDGIGGATGSSKGHTEKALENSAEVQKGDAPMERKLQRLFRNPQASILIKRCNDFGAGGVSVAIGELAPSLEIDLDAVPKKYRGLDGTELAISESQERMAVVVSSGDAGKFADFAASENLECTKVAEVTDTGRLVMKWKGDTIVDLRRDFLDTNGTTASAKAEVVAPSETSLPFGPSGMQAGDKASWLCMISSLNCCSQRGLVERFDSSIGACAVFHPYGGATLSTPPEAMCSKLPLLEGDTNTGTIFSFGFNPDISKWSPYHGAQYAVLESVAKIAASGGDVSRVRFTFQEYFEKLRGDPRRWGKPLAALLGALDAQLSLDCASIGGKDSMSGSFKDIDVPPTLVSFAICAGDVRNAITPEFKRKGSRVALVKVEKRADLTPDWSDAKKKYGLLFNAIKEGKIISAHSLRFGGLAEAVSKMSFGNEIGFEFLPSFSGDAFALDYGAVLVELAEGADVDFAEIVGATTGEKTVRFGSLSIPISELKSAWNSPLEKIFPTEAADSQNGSLSKPVFENKNIAVSPSKYAKPQVFIPVFPGTNCEYDTARAFERAGAVVKTFVFRNMNGADIDFSISEMGKLVGQSQILALPGGFSAGDEPAGSGKFIAAVFRNPELTDAVMDLIKNRKGLVLGICNGFQALIKLGLVPFGKVCELTSDSPTLTYNNIGRHVSRYVRTRVTSTLSPWLSLCNVGDEHVIPVSHGEGKFIASPRVMESLLRNGQIATQYVDENGNPSASIDYNPNGSLEAVEGITSPDGLVFGKMGHTERFGENVGKNIPGNKIQPIFESGVNYFR